MSGGADAANARLIADYSIRRLHARFVDIAWRKDAEGFADCFVADGVWKIAGMRMQGRTEIRDTFARLLGACEKVSLILGPPLLDIGDGEATGRVYATEFAKMMDGTSAMTIGIYYDRYRVEDGEWRFASRHFALQYRGPADLTAPFVDCPDYGPAPAMPGPDEPTFTRRKI